MSSNRYIRKSLYNLGKKEIGHLVPGETALDVLQHQRDRLKKLSVSIDTCIDVNLWFRRIQESVPERLEDFVDASACHSLITGKYSGRVLDSEEFMHAIFPEKYPFAVSNHVAGRKERIAEINEELRQLRQELKTNANKDLFFRIKELVQELHTIISFCYSKQRSHLRSYRKSISTNLVVDIRKKLRQTIQFIFKYLPDFSGCEEEARFKSTTGYKPLFLNLNRRIDEVQQNFFTQCAGLINGFSTAQAKQQRTAIAAGYL